jgi:hypothetical protein
MFHSCDKGVIFIEEYMSLFARKVNVANQGGAEAFSQQVHGFDNAIEIVYSEIHKKSANNRKLHGLA